MVLHEKRKAEHLEICRNEDVRSRVPSGFSCYALKNTALPELDLESIDLSCGFLGKALHAPLLISSMTGGTAEAARINRNLAQAAQALGLAMGVGSQRAGIDDPTLMTTYQVRDVAPDIALYANLGAVQLNYGYGLNECRRAVESIEADALILHLNCLQEALQPGGNTRFSGLLEAIKEICQGLKVPVIVKEVGWGLAIEDARRLANAGVSALDIAGAGGTSWSRVEALRGDERQRRVAAPFEDWGVSTAQALDAVFQADLGLPLLASGGLTNGVEAAKALALGASMVGFAGVLLDAACTSTEALVDQLMIIIDQLRIAMFCTGSAVVADLGRDKIETRCTSQ